MVRIKWRFDLTLILCLAHLTRIEADSRFSFSFFKSSMFQIIWHAGIRRKLDWRLDFAKGQKISKQNCWVVNSPKIQKNIFLFFYPDDSEILEALVLISSFRCFQVVRIEKQILLFVGRSYGSTILFRKLLAFSNGHFSNWNSDWKSCLVPRSFAFDDRDNIIWHQTRCQQNSYKKKQMNTEFIWNWSKF